MVYRQQPKSNCPAIPRFGVNVLAWFSSVQLKMVSTRSEYPICASPRLSEVSSLVDVCFTCNVQMQIDAVVYIHRVRALWIIGRTL